MVFLSILAERFHQSLRDWKESALLCVVCCALFFLLDRSGLSRASSRNEEDLPNENLAEKEEDEGEEEEEEEEEATALEDDACCRLLEDVVAAIVGVRTMSLDIFCALRSEEELQNSCAMHTRTKFYIYTFTRSCFTNKKRLAKASTWLEAR
jgi:hypothetical protein